jgi:hemerythrin
LAIEWTPYLSVGNNVIDNQHKELFNRLNGLIDAMSEGHGEEELTGVISFLGDYVVVHFRTEEELMDRYSYVAASAHKAQHAVLVNDFLLIKKQLETTGASEPLAIATEKRLGDWLINHIGRTDKQLGAFLKTASLKKAA